MDSVLNAARWNIGSETVWIDNHCVRRSSSVLAPITRGA